MTHRLLTLLFCLLMPYELIADDLSDDISVALTQRSGQYTAMSQQIWQWAELGYQETLSSTLLQSHLEDSGFRIEAGVADIPTSFIATFGSGEPIIAFLAEYDALPNASQSASPKHDPLEPGSAGHACGHNLFGVGAAAAAVSVKNWMQKSATPTGTIRVYGTPAEEGGAGKAYMVREGLFDDVDIAIHWHPGDNNVALPGTTLANRSAKFRFQGVASHAAAAPEKGRSALDGVEAMNHMVNMLREHVPATTRIHYTITQGGSAPNVVPNFAESFYYVRSPSPEALLDIWKRVEDAARGASIGTSTTVDWEVIHGTYNILPNVTLAKVMDQSLKTFGGINYTQEEQNFAEKIVKTYLKEPRLKLGSEKTSVPFSENIVKSSGSSDVGDVSWMAPTVGVMTATWVPGTAPHSWQSTAASGMSIGHKGMFLAAKSMALTSIKLLQNPELIEQARREWEDRRGIDFNYEPLLGEREPALDYRQ